MNSKSNGLQAHQATKGIQGSWSSKEAPLIEVMGTIPSIFVKCYVCRKGINTDKDIDFSSTMRNGERQFFHLGCAQEGDPKTFEQFVENERTLSAS